VGFAVARGARRASHCSAKANWWRQIRTCLYPAGADVYMLKHFLHGSRDAEAISILKNCHVVIPQNGTLLIIELILPSQVSHADPQIKGHPDE
jgi:hypothetical protein